jgi:hypothetical protein
MPKLFLGPMSKNIVDAIIKLNSCGFDIGFIPSRRQIDHNGGYVNNWKTIEFVQYVKNANKSIIICRDHAGPLQGKYDDSGTGFNSTVMLMDFCHKFNKDVLFEIGTEESIRKFSPDELYLLLDYVKVYSKCFNKIKYVVIQSGTNLKMDTNIGEYEEDRLSKMINIAKDFNIMTKEHNGDYLDGSLIKSKFSKGLDSINIAPELGKIETECYLDRMTAKQKEKFFTICYKSNTWVKWLKGDKEFNPFENKIKLVKVCGHYVFSSKQFIECFGNIDIKDQLHDKIKNRVCNILEKV